MREGAPKAVTAISRTLQEQIEHGLLAGGSQLPAERKLSELFATTRVTVREALLQLESLGLVYREERRGWFISPPRLAYNLMQRSHFHAMVTAQGRVPTTEVISARLLPATAAVCERLQLQKAPLNWETLDTLTSQGGAPLLPAMSTRLPWGSMIHSCAAPLPSAPCV